MGYPAFSLSGIDSVYNNLYGQNHQKREKIMPDKICNKCGEAKPADVEHWYFRDGKPVSGPCKECRKHDALERYRANPEHGKARMKQWRLENPEKAKDSCKRWRNENPDKVREINRLKYLENREARIEYERERRRSGIAKEQARARAAANPNYYREQRQKMKPETKARINAWMRQNRKENPERFAGYERKRYETDPHRKVSASLSSAIVGHLNKFGGRKSTIRRDLVGWAMKELVVHLEGLFEEGMSWDNYGEWHIDHIIPKSAVKVDSQDDPAFKWIWSLSNLAPLWAKDNLEKHARTDWILPDSYENPKLRELYEERDHFLLMFG